MTNKEAIEFLKNMIDTQSVGAVLHNGEKALWQYHIEALNMAISALQSHWIPVTERLPFAEYGESANVLATCRNREQESPDEYRWVRILYFNGGNWCYPTGETYEQQVIAWMPLPEPWEGEEKND